MHAWPQSSGVLISGSQMPATTVAAFHFPVAGMPNSSQTEELFPVSAAQEQARFLFKQHQPTAVPVCPSDVPRSGRLPSPVKGRKGADVPIGETVEESMGNASLTTAGCLQETMASHHFLLHLEGNTMDSDLCLNNHNKPKHTLSSDEQTGRQQQPSQCCANKSNRTKAFPQFSPGRAPAAASTGCGN